VLLNDSRRSADTTGSGFGAWRRARPFVGGLFTIVSGLAIFLSSQLDLGNIRIQLGIEGFQATVIPIGLVLLGVLAIFMPAHHVFYGVLTLAVAVYSLVGVNLGGFVVGMLLGCVGGVLVVAWMPRAAQAEAAGADDGDAAAPADDDATEPDDEAAPSLEALLGAPETAETETGRDATAPAGPAPFLRRDRAQDAPSTDAAA
jgi:hypothetical protein